VLSSRGLEGELKGAADFGNSEAVGPASDAKSRAGMNTISIACAATPHPSLPLKGEGKKSVKVIERRRAKPALDNPFPP